MTYRYYSSTAGEMLLQASITDSDTSLIVDTVAGLPTSFPYTLILDYGTASEEVVDVSNAVGTTLTIARGKDSTVAQAHTAGAVIRHGVTARDHRESRDHEAATVAHGVTGDVVGTSDTQTLEKKTFLPSADHVALTLQGRAGNTEPIAEIQDSAGAVQFQVYDDEIYATDGAGTRWWGIRGGAAATFWGRFFDLVVTGTKVAVGATKQVGATGKFLQLVDTDGSTNLFSVDADGNVDAANFPAGAWSSYTPTLSNITIGNGTVTAKYTQIGQTVIGRVSITMGSTTTFSPSTFLATLPVTPASTDPNAVGSVYLLDSSVGSPSRRAGVVVRTGASQVFFVSSEDSTTATVTSTSPWTWASGDVLSFDFTYEAA